MVGELIIINFKDLDKLLNPERSIGDGVKAKDLNSFNFSQIVDFFKERLNDFYFVPIEFLIKKRRKKKSNLGFILIAHCSMIIDVLSSYHHPDKIYVVERFKAFLENDFKHGFEIKFKKQGTAQYWHKTRSDSFKDIIINNQPTSYDINGKSIAEVFYYAFRNSIIHNTSILSYGEYIYNQKNLIEYDCWKPPNGGFELSINPILLFKELKDYLKSYVVNLKNLSDPAYNQLRENFKIKFRFDFGYTE